MPADVVAVTSTTPTEPGGLVAVHRREVAQLTLVAATVPNVIVVAPGAGSKKFPSRRDDRAALHRPPVGVDAQDEGGVPVDAGATIGDLAVPDRVVAAAARDPIQPGAAVEDVVVAAPLQRVVARSALDVVVAAATVEEVVTAEPAQHVVAGVTGKVAAVERRVIRFEVEAFEGERKIGDGRHARGLVNAESFTKRLAGK